MWKRHLRLQGEGIKKVSKEGHCPNVKYYLQKGLILFPLPADKKEWFLDESRIYCRWTQPKTDLIDYN